MERTAFITGVTGFVGGHLAGVLLERGGKVVGLHNDYRPANTLSLLGLTEKVTLVRGDVCDDELMRRVLAKYHVQDVYHLATQAIVSVALKDPLTTYRVSCMGTASILKACHEVGVSAALCTGSDKVYGEGLDKKETSPLDVKGIYESSKVCMDYIARSFFYIYGLPVVVSRACNVYGEHDVNKRIIPNTIRSLRDGVPPIIFKNEPSLREYIYVRDVCEAYITLVENIATSKGDVFNIGTHEVIGQEELVKLIIRISGVNAWPDYVDKPPSLLEIHQQSIDSNKFRSAFGWKNRFDLKKGLERTWRQWK